MSLLREIRLMLSPGLVVASLPWRLVYIVRAIRKMSRNKGITFRHIARSRNCVVDFLSKIGSKRGCQWWNFSRLLLNLGLMKGALFKKFDLFCLIRVHCHVTCIFFFKMVHILIEKGPEVQIQKEEKQNKNYKQERLEKKLPLEKPTHWPKDYDLN